MTASSALSLLGLALAALPTLLSPARAHGADYDPADTAWHGLSELASTADMVHLQLDVAETLDWRRVDPQRVLLLVAPLVAPDPASVTALRRFVADGGRLVVADDFREGAAWLRPFGLELLPQAGDTEARYEDRVHLPMVGIDPSATDRERGRRWMAVAARVTPWAFLAHNLKAPVVLNHPASLRLADAARQTGVLWGRYETPELGWLAEVEHGQGRVLAIADPSLLINAMVGRFHDNRQFAANVLRYYCVADRPCRVTLIANLAQVQGDYRGKPEPPLNLRAGLEHLQALLQALAEALRGPVVAPVLVLTLLALLGLPVLWLARTSPPVLPPRSPALRTNSILFDAVGAWLAQGQADFRRPARLLSAHLARLVGRLDGTARPGPDSHGRARQGSRTGAGGAVVGTGLVPAMRTDLVDSLVLDGRCSPQASQRLREVLEALQAVTREDGEPIGRARFAQLAAEVEWAESLIRHTGTPRRNEG